MSHPAAAFPFAYLLPTDRKPRTRYADRGAVTTGSRGRRLAVLVLTFLAPACGPAAMVPSAVARAMIERECPGAPDEGPGSTGEPLLCS